MWLNYVWNHILIENGIFVVYFIPVALLFFEQFLQQQLFYNFPNA